MTHQFSTHSDWLAAAHHLGTPLEGTALNSLYVSIKSTPNLCVLEALIYSILEGEPS